MSLFKFFRRATTVAAIMSSFAKQVKQLEKLEQDCCAKAEASREAARKLEGDAAAMRVTADFDHWEADKANRMAAKLREFVG